MNGPDGGVGARGADGEVAGELYRGVQDCESAAVLYAHDAPHDWRGGAALEDAERVSGILFWF